MPLLTESQLNGPSKLIASMLQETGEHFNFVFHTHISLCLLIVDI